MEEAIPMRNLAPEVSVPAVLNEFGIPTSKEMIAALTRVKDAHRQT
jgi:hypothetical protein